MNRTQVTLIKLGGSLITHKRNKYLISEYLNTIDQFLSGNEVIGELSQSISQLIDYQKLNIIFRMISDFLIANPNDKIILIHGAGSIGHSLVLHFLKTHPDLQSVFPIVKLAVSIQNQLIISIAIKNGLNVISMVSHQILHGSSSDEVSSKEAIAQDLSLIENIIENSNTIPIFYGDVGFTKAGWKVFSGDIIPLALVKRFSKIWIKNAIFLTSVPNKQTGIYTKDPSFNDAKYIKRIEVENNNYSYYGINNEKLFYEGDNASNKEKFDVTEAMGGKIRNLLDLAANFTSCWVVGLEEFADALRKKDVGTVVKPKYPPSSVVRFLGVGDAFSSSGNSSAGVYIKLNGYGILFDCGPSILTVLKKYGLNNNDIDIILISHYHGDHIAGIPFFLLDANLLKKREKPLYIIGPSNIRKKVTELSDIFFERIFNQEFSFQCHYTTISPNENLNIDNIIINAFKTHHSPESQGYRIKSKKLQISYTGDTGWTDNLVSLLNDTDLAITECSFYKYEIETHLNFKQIIKLQSLIKTKQLVLIHLGTEGLSKINLLAKKYNITIPLEGQILLI